MKVTLRKSDHHTNILFAKVWITYCNVLFETAFFKVKANSMSLFKRDVSILPPVGPIEEIAEGAKQGPITKIPMDEKIGHRFLTQDKILRLAEGGGVKVKRQRYHPDPIAEDKRYGITEGEIIQAIGRGRGVNRTAQDPLAVDILTNVALPITVHEALELNQMVPDQYDIMMMNGALPTGARDQARAYPSIFETEKSAEGRWKYLKVNIPQNTIIDYIIAKCGVLKSRGANVPLTHMVKYRDDGSRGRSKTFLYNKAVIFDPLAWLKENVSDKTILIDEAKEILPGAVPSVWIQSSVAASEVSDQKIAMLPFPVIDRIPHQDGNNEKTLHTLHDLAEIFHVSENKLQKLLKKHSGDEQAVAVSIFSETICKQDTKPLNALKSFVNIDQKLLDKI